jgi:hypothetical protein
MPWRRMEEWKYSSNIPNVGTRWRWAVAFTSLPLWPLANQLPVPILIGGLDGLQIRYGEASLLSALEPLLRGSTSRNSASVPTELSLLLRRWLLLVSLACALETVRGLRIAVPAQSEACVVFCRWNIDTAGTTATQITLPSLYTYSKLHGIAVK